MSKISKQINLQVSSSKHRHMYFSVKLPLNNTSKTEGWHANDSCLTGSAYTSFRKRVSNGNIMQSIICREKNVCSQMHSVVHRSYLGN